MCFFKTLNVSSVAQGVTRLFSLQVIATRKGVGVVLGKVPTREDTGASNGRTLL